MSNLFRNTIAYITSFRVIRNVKEQETVKRADITPVLSELLNAITIASSSNKGGTEDPSAKILMLMGA
jgi:hypothetical protein